MLVEGGGPSAQLHLSGTTKVQRAFISGVSGHTPWGFKAFGMMGTGWMTGGLSQRSVQQLLVVMSC